MSESANKTAYELIPKRGALRGEVLFANIDVRRQAKPPMVRQLLATVPGQGRELSPPSRPSLRRARQRVWQGEGEVAQDRSNTGDRENPFWLRSVKPVLLVGTRSADRIRTSGQSTAQTGRTRCCTRPTCINVPKHLANTGPSTQSQKPT